MKLYKPKFWEDKRNILSIILYPFRIIYKTLSYLKKSFTKSIKFKTYVICVGNINLGGTGKTPLTIFIANFLKRSGKKTEVIRKFYKNLGKKKDISMLDCQVAILENAITRYSVSKKELESLLDKNHNRENIK